MVDNKNKIRALFIFEILGRPPEHLKKAFEEFINRFEQKGIHIEDKKIHEPRLVEEKNVRDLYTAFAEVELTFDSVELLFSLVTNALPSTVEILEPQNLNIKNFELGSALTELAVKLHRYDEVTKTVAIERDNLLRRLMEIDPRLKAAPQVKISEDKESLAENLSKEKVKENREDSKVSKKKGRKK